MRRVRVQAFLPVESYEVLAKHTKEKGQSLSGSIVALIESGLSSQKQEESLEDSDYLTKDEFNQTFEELCKRVTSNFLVIESRLKTLFTRNKTEPEPEFYLIWKRWHELANLLLGQDESLGESLSESQEKNLAPPEGLGKPVAIHSHESSNGDGVPIYKEKKEEGKKSIKSIVNSLSESPSEPTKDTASNSLSESPSEPTEDTIGDSPSESPSEPTEDTISKASRNSIIEYLLEDSSESSEEPNEKFLVKPISESPDDSIDESSLSYKLNIRNDAWFVTKKQEDSTLSFWDGSTFVRDISLAKRYANKAGCKQAVTRLKKKIPGVELLYCPLCFLEEFGEGFYRERHISF